MNWREFLVLTLATLSISVPLEATAGLAATATRDAAEAIFAKFGRGPAGQTMAEVGQATARVVAQHGENAIPFLRNAGHAGFKALETAGEKAPNVLKLYARRGDEALSVITDPKRLSLFIKHGDSAADALIKHPGIADDLIERFGNNAIAPLNGISRQSAQHLGMVEKDGLLSATARSAELLPVIDKHGDQAMKFIWKHKGALAVTAVLATFLADPEPYISGVKGLASLIANSINWTLIIVGILIISFLPFIGRSVVKARRAIKNEQSR